MIIDRMKAAIAAILFCAASLPLWSQNLDGLSSPLIDPGIDQGEEIHYRIEVNDQVRSTVVKVEVMSGEKGPLYLVHRYDAEGEHLVRLLRTGLIPLGSTATLEIGGSRYESETRLLEAPKADGQIFAMSIDDLGFQLRGYPFDDPRDLPLRLLGQSENGNSIDMRIVYRRVETITINGREYRAHRLELVTRLPGAMALFRSAIPRTFFWYNADAPHQLLRYQNRGGIGDSADLTMEMRDYRVISRE